MTAWIGSRGGNEGGNSRMNCRVHFEREATSFCEDCHAPMCPECNRTLGTFCMNCIERLAKSGKQEILKTFGISIIAFILGTWFIIDSDTYQSQPILTILMCLMTFFFPFGWKAISRISDYFLILASMIGWVGWILYFMFKFIIALLIGWIFGIPKMVEMIRLWKSYQRSENVVKEMKMVPKNRVVNE